MITAGYMKTFMAIVLYVLAVFVSNCAFGVGGGRGDTVEAWETVKGNFKIRVTEYKEKNPVHLTHFFYVFESSDAASGEWHEIVEVKNDDDVPLPRDQMRFVNDRIAYVFMNEKYAVSTDGGKVWKVWEVTPKNLPQLQIRGHIKNAHIELDGSGQLTLDALIDGKINELTLYTHDYGQHWNAK